MRRREIIDFMTNVEGELRKAGVQVSVTAKLAEETADGRKVSGDTIEMTMAMFGDMCERLLFLHLNDDAEEGNDDG